LDYSGVVAPSSTIRNRAKERAVKKTGKYMAQLPATGQRLAVLAIVAAALAGTSHAATKGAHAGNVAHGHKLYASHSCAACHAIGGKGGKSGPDLSKVGTKRDAKWLVEFMKDPHSKEPNATMRAVHASDKDLHDLAAYMLTLK
jgi:mono/diheme cytochrome c family protein